MFDVRHVSMCFRTGSKNIGSKMEVQALSDVSLAIPAGSFSAFVGPSGSGKSTLLALLGALERPTAGSVLFEDRDLAACSDMELARVRRRMGFVFQNFSLLPQIPAWENITYPLIPRGLSRAERQTLGTKLLEQVGLSEKYAAIPEELSGGEQQRVAMARALAGRPQVLLADEPTAQLDPAAAAAIISLITAAHTGGATVIVSSHDPALVACATSRFELRAGRLVTAAG